MERDPDIISRIERVLFDMILNVTGRTYFDVFSYCGRIIVFRLLAAARSLHETDISGVEWLETAAREFSEILIDAEYMTSDESDLLPMSVKEMKADMQKNRVDLDNLTIADLGISANPKTALKLSTIHNAKGREYKAVAMIDLHEDSIPHYRATSPEELEEAKRLFYVGVTRAEQYLLYVTSNLKGGKRPSRFLRADLGVGLC